jgi:hypothetical protein
VRDRPPTERLSLILVVAPALAEAALDGLDPNLPVTG